MPEKVFVSYAHKDGGKLALQLREDLAARGYEVWLDVARLHGGSHWSSEIERALDAAEIVLALLSTGSFDSIVCRGEQLWALDRKKCVLPILVHGDAPRPVYVYALQYLDFSDPALHGLRLADLLEAIANRAGATLAAGYETRRYDTIPPLPTNFVPRPAELEVLRQVLLGDRDRQHVALVALRGMGGIGKTVLAQALCRDPAVQAAFPDGIVWVKVGQNPSEAHLIEQMRQAARALGEPAQGFDTLETSSNLLRAMLPDKAALIVLDDVWGPGPVHLFLVDDARLYRLLFTTRDAEIGAATGALWHSLDLLPEAQAQRMLAAYAGRSEADLPPEAVGILRECHGLALALAMIGAMLREEPRQRWADVLESLQTADLEEIQMEFPNYPYPSLVAAIEVSVQSLPPEVQRVYLDLAVFPEDTASPESALQVAWRLEGRAARRFAAQLARSSLVTRDPAGRLTLHDLQLDYVRKRTGDVRSLHDRFLGGYLSQCPDGWATGPNDGYFFEHLAYHLKEAGRDAELRDLLLDFNWLQARLEATDVTGLIADYDALSAGPPGRAETASSPWSQVQDSLRLSAHVLALDKAQLAGQLLGRLQGAGADGPQRLLESARDRKGRPWLRPRTASLTPPGPLVRNLSGHVTGAVTAVAVTPDGRWAISAAYDRTLKVWEVRTGREVRTMSGHADVVDAVAVMPDGRLAISGSGDQTLKVWELASGREVRTLAGHADVVSAVAVTPDGRFVFSGSHDGELKVWEVATWRQVQTSTPHTTRINSLVVTPDGRLVISASHDGTLKVKEVGSGREVRTLEGHTAWIGAVAVTPDGRLAISGSTDTTLKVWEVATGQEVRTLEGHALGVSGVAVTPDGKLAVSASYDGMLRVWEVESGRQVQELAGHAAGVTGVAVTPDGKLAISASEDRTLKVWQIGRGRELRPPTRHGDQVTAVAMTPDGKLAISASHDSTLKVWEVERAREARMLAGHANAVSSVAVTGNGKLALSASRDYTLKVWEVRSGRELRSLSNPARRFVRAVAMTPDGRWAVSASDDQVLTVWEMKGGRAVRTLKGHAGLVWSVAMTPDGKLAISGSRDRTLRVWELGTGREVWRRESGSEVWAVAVTPNSELAISGSSDGTLTVWELRTGREVRSWKGHTAVTAVAATAEGRLAISSSTDGTLKVWDVASAREVAAFTADAGCICAVAADGTAIVMGDALGRIHFLELCQGSAER